MRNYVRLNFLECWSSNICVSSWQDNQLFSNMKGLLYHKLSSAKIVKVLPNFHMYENHSYPDCASRNWNRGI